MMSREGSCWGASATLLPHRGSFRDLKRPLGFNLHDHVSGVFLKSGSTSFRAEVWSEVVDLSGEFSLALHQELARITIRDYLVLSPIQYICDRKPSIQVVSDLNPVGHLCASSGRTGKITFRGLASCKSDDGDDKQGEPALRHGFLLSGCGIGVILESGLDNIG